MKNSVIIVSGGMDSITLLYDHKDEIALGISFDYGSNHNAREISSRVCLTEPTQYPKDTMPTKT